MPKWWPWGRQPEPVAPPAPAARPEPVWQRLAAVTPTTGDIEPTAHLNGFTATLTTSHNPAFTRPVQLLAVDEHRRLPVLDTGPAQPVPPPPVPAPQSRNWGPRLPSVQRAYVGTPVQRDSLPDQPAAAPLPVIDTGGGPEPQRAMVQASDPDERRPLDAITDDATPAALPAPPPTTGEPLTMAPMAVQHPVVPAIQRLSTDTSPSPAVVQRVAATAPAPLPASSSTGPSTASDIPVARVSEVFTVHHTEVETAPLRHLHTVQRAERVAPSIPTLAPLPVVTSTPSTPVTRGEQDSPKPAPTNVIQRIPDADEPTAEVADPVQQPAPAVDLPVVDVPDGASSMRTEPAVVTTAPLIAQNPSHAPAAVQRLMPQQSPMPRPSVAPTPSMSLPPMPSEPSTPSPPVSIDSPAVARPDAGTPAVEPVIATELPTVMAESPSVRAHNAPPVAQRSSTTASAAAETHPAPVPRAQPVSAFAESQSPTVMRAMGDSPQVAPNPMPPVPVPARRPVTPGPVPPTDSPVAQRISLPVVDSTPTPTAVPPVRRSLPPTSPAVQRSTGSARRLVVLPPIRSTDDPGPAPSVAAGRTDGAEVFSSPRPVGLQRMFGAGTQPEGHHVKAPLTNVESPPATPTPEPWNAMDTTQSTAIAHEYDAASNTITFGSPGLQSIQRATEEAAPAAETAAPITAAPAMTSAPAATGSGAAVPAGTDVDELVNRVYDALAARLRAELWLDRERAGALMDLR